MASESSSSGWFKQAEQLEQERKSGAVAPPPQRLPPRPGHKPLLPSPHPVTPPAPAEKPAAEAAPAASPPAPQPLPNPPTPRTVARLQRSGPVSHAFHRPMPTPPAKLERSGAVPVPPTRVAHADPSPTPPAPVQTAGRFSLVPDGDCHRLVFARPAANGVGPQVVGRLSVPELRQLKAALDRYLGAVDADGVPFSEAPPARVAAPQPAATDGLLTPGS